MNVTELPIEESISTHLPGAAREGAKLVGVSFDDAPIRIVEAINSFIAEPPKKKWFQRIDNWNDRAMPVGSLWATQMLRQFGWEWVNMIQHDHDDFKVLAMLDRERTVGIKHLAIKCSWFCKKAGRSGDHASASGFSRNQLTY